MDLSFDKSIFKEDLSKITWRLPFLPLGAMRGAMVRYNHLAAQDL